MAQEDDLIAISRRLDELIQSSAEPREALAELVRAYGSEQTRRTARIVFASWRSRIDLVEDTLRQIIAEQGGRGS